MCGKENNAMHVDAEKEVETHSVELSSLFTQSCRFPGIIPGMGAANEGRCYNVASSLIG